MKTSNLTKFAIILAIEAIFCFTPLGSLPALGPIVMTLAMIPVIITGITMGVKYASLMGFFAGLFSFIVWTFMPPNPVVAFVFSPFYSFNGISGNFYSLIICFIPRILCGTITAISCALLKNAKATIRYGISGFVGSMINTLGVTLMIALFFGEIYASIVGQSLILIITTTIITSGIPEAILASMSAILLGRLKR